MKKECVQMKTKINWQKNHTYDCEKSNSEQHGQILERVLEIYQHVAALSRHTVIEQGEW